MPYPESCPECGGPFRNTGTHFTARRNEVGRHVLLELGCQNTSNRFWWDFTTGLRTEDGRIVPARRDSLAVSTATLSTIPRPLMQSATVSDRIIDQFKLLEVYDARYRVDARKELARNVHAHPTLSEALQEAFHGLEGHMINF